ncbi:MAG: hypothetical protein ACI4XP_03700 [Acutalibacteraceae bacterium]
MKFIFDKNSDNRKRLENILRFIRDILESREPYKSQTVFYIIKILTDRINSGKCIDKLCESHSKPDYGIDIEDDNITKYGYCYRNISENKKIEEVPFEYGCIFEIGRLIKEHNISFLNIKYSEFESENE